MVEDNGFEPFASACKADVLAKYTNPPKKYNIDALLQGRLGLRLLCCSYRGAVIEALYTINGGGGWIRTTALFTDQIYSLVQSTSLPRLQNCYTLFRMCVLKHTVITTMLPRLTADMSVQYALIR